ncbi:TPA: hypothetical protein HA338_01760 [Methanosarcina acetivorans]|uniref:Uncharacterized protein n=2 Tax=Methanosarcina acetivorans TaxID=2214 RepID=Q8TJI8_METAC|nr:hypothetical protein [Methanosarcina acetivorans]AAM07147.1 predicted protein [Methanosarcina acetivorans C2A]HIH92802.1 hypothetical protein [Methanosarcina acetivorans]
MAESGDRRAFIQTKTGFLSWPLKTSFAVGDRVILVPSYRGYEVLEKLSGPVPGDRVLLFPQKAGGYVVASQTHLPIKVCDYWHRSAAYMGEVVDLGTFIFSWNGYGLIYLSSSKTVAANLYVDDAIRAITPHGTLNFQQIGFNPFGNEQFYGLANITSICRAGNNSVTVQIYDRFGQGLGYYPDELWLIKV